MSVDRGHGPGGGAGEGESINKGEEGRRAGGAGNECEGVGGAVGGCRVFSPRLSDSSRVLRAVARWREEESCLLLFPAPPSHKKRFLNLSHSFRKPAPAHDAYLRNWYIHLSLSLVESSLTSTLLINFINPRSLSPQSTWRRTTQTPPSPTGSLSSTAKCSRSLTPPRSSSPRSLPTLSRPSVRTPPLLVRALPTPF